jgi:hypothetical protein
MLYGLFEILYYSLNEFSRLASDFTLWRNTAIGATALIGFLFVLLGRLVRSDWKPGWLLGGLAGLSIPITFVALLLLPATSYLKPAAITILGIWQDTFLHDDTWNQESFRQQYWAVQALKTPEGKALENFSGYPSPEQGGSRIPASHRESQTVISNIDSTRVAEHFQANLALLAKLLWTKERPLPEVLRSDMERFFQENPGTAYDHGKAVQLAGTEMQSLLEKKIGRIILIARIALVSLLVVLWLPMCAWAMYDAYKKLEPITAKS